MTILTSLSLLRFLEAHGFEARIAGGAVRDFCAGKQPKDIDIATTARPEQILATFDKTIPTGLQHGTVTVVYMGASFEVTTLRKDVETDGRRAKVEFTDDWREDAARRDFTFNAMFMDSHGNIIDYFNGQADLHNNIVRFVGDPAERIKEDYLRIMRYFRFLSRLPEPTEDRQTLEIIKAHVSGLDQISGERIWAELLKIFESEHIDYIAHLMNQSHVPQYVSTYHKFDSSSLLRTKQLVPCPILRMIAAYHWAGYALLDQMKTRFKTSLDEQKLVETYLYMRGGEWQNPSLFDIVHACKTEADWQRCRRAVALLATESDRGYRLWRWFESHDRPVWTITGQTLIAEGMAPGPWLGAELAKRREEWFWSQHADMRQL